MVREPSQTLGPAPSPCAQYQTRRPYACRLQAPSDTQSQGIYPLFDSGGPHAGLHGGIYSGDGAGRSGSDRDRHSFFRSHRGERGDSGRQYHDALVRPVIVRYLPHMSHRMSALHSTDDPFRPGDILKSVHRLVICNRHIPCPAYVLQLYRG